MSELWTPISADEVDFAPALSRDDDKITLFPQPGNRIGLRQLFDELPGLTGMLTEGMIGSDFFLEAPSTPVLNEIIRHRFSQVPTLGVEFVDVEDILPDDVFADLIGQKKVPRARDPRGLYHDTVVHALGAASLPEEPGEAFVELANLASGVKSSDPAYSQVLAAAIAKAFENQTPFALFPGFDGTSELNGAHLLSAALIGLEPQWADRVAAEIQGLGYEVSDDGTIPKERAQVTEHYRLLQADLSQPSELL